MYNQVIIDRLNNLTNLGALKKFNVSVISKNNDFGDIVKFFAQINSQNIIAKISFKATGCSTFLAMCSFFCDIVVGKSLDDAKNIGITELEQITTLDDSKKHVYNVILDTFALLIKKYEKDLSAGKVKPLDIEEKEPKTKTKKSKETVTVEKDISDIIDNKKVSKVENKTNKKSDKIEVKETEEIETPKESVEMTTVNNAESEKNTEPEINETELKAKNKKREKIKTEKPKKEKKLKKESKKNNILTEIEKINVEIAKTTKDINKQTQQSKKTEQIKPQKQLKEDNIVNDTENIVRVKDRNKNKLDLSSIHKQMQQIEEKKQQESKAKENSVQISHLSSLREKINTKETNEKMKNNSNSLNNILARINTKKK